MTLNLNKLISIPLAVALIFAPIGCAPTDTQIQQDGNVVATAILNIAALEQPVNPALAAQLVTAANDLKSATANWTTGSTVAIINTAAQAAEIALAAIPQTAAFAPLIPIAVAALDLLIENVAQPAVSAHVLSASTATNYHGATIPHRLFRSREGDFKAEWNEKAKQAGLKQAVLP